MASDEWTPPPAAVVTLHNNMMWALRKAYPHMADGWCIRINQSTGVLTVWNEMLSGKMGFDMKIADVDPEMRKVVRFGGELLERYRIARDSALDMREAMENMERNFAGEAVYDS